MNKIQSTHLPNIGITTTTYTDKELKPILDEVDEIKKDFDNYELVKYNSNLAGHIKREYSLSTSKEHLENLMLPAISQYINSFNMQNRYAFQGHVEPGTKNMSVRLENTWVNFQKKHEFNPMHRHGGIISFALWLQVPYSLSDETKVFPDVAAYANSSGVFSFHYTNVLGELTTNVIPVDKTYKNCIVIFPAELNHSVNPFYTSDDYRISVSGNWVVG